MIFHFCFLWHFVLHFCVLNDNLGGNYADNMLFYILSGIKSIRFLLLFPKRIKFIRQITECHADDGNDDVGDGRPPLEHLDEEFQAEIVDEDVADGHKKIPDNLCPTTQSGARETNMTRHPETRKESDGELKHEGGDMGRESDETKFDDLGVKDEMVENIVQHPFQNKVQATASRIAEQFKAHELAEWGIEKVDDRGQGAFYPRFYVFQS